MKSLLYVLLFLLTVNFGIARAAEKASPTQRQIQQIMDRMEIAANAHDAARFLAPFLHKASLVFVINGHVIHGWSALYKQQLKWWHHGKSDAVYVATSPVKFQRLSADVMVTTQTLASRRTSPDGKLSKGSFAVTDIWQKLPEGWCIVYAHESWAR